jgi:hypothetical protein
MTMGIEDGTCVVVADVNGGIVTAVADGGEWVVQLLDLRRSRCASSVRAYPSYLEAVRAVRWGMVEWKK